MQTHSSPCFFSSLSPPLPFVCVGGEGGWRGHNRGRGRSANVRWAQYPCILVDARLRLVDRCGYLNSYNNINNCIQRRRSIFFIQSPCGAVNCLQHIRASGQGTMVWKSRAITHWAPVTCNVLCAFWDKGTAELLSLTELKSHLF